MLANLKVFTYFWSVRNDSKSAWNINAWNVNAWNVNAWNVNAWNVNAWNVNAWNVNAWNVNAWNINAWVSVLEKSGFQEIPSVLLWFRGTRVKLMLSPEFCCLICSLSLGWLTCMFQRIYCCTSSKYMKYVPRITVQLSYFNITSVLTEYFPS